MLIRFAVKNLFSFKEQTEFNLFPNKSNRLIHHKVELNGIDVLRLSALYGANGSGKSNFIKSVALLQSIIQEGVIEDDIENKKFKLSAACKSLPMEMGIEFHCNQHNYYYAIAIDNSQVVYEYFAESIKEKDVLIFERKIENDIQKITFFPEYYKDEKNKVLASVLEEKIVEKNQLLFSFLSKKYENEFAEVKNAYEWFDEKLVIIYPEVTPSGLAHILDTSKEFDSFANTFISSLNTGISKLCVEKKSVDDFFNSAQSGDVKDVLKKIKSNPDAAVELKNKITGEEVFVINENGKTITKRLYTEHTDENGNMIAFSLPEESDGTKRLMDYIPALESLLNSDMVFLIDEIERSIHPLVIKEIISKFSHDENAKGQLLFTTHESFLLDQDILRTDEIWFCQKDISGASKLYSLNDFKVHNTIDIENGYLNGRYGGIPFLSNLHDLNWNKYSDVK